MNVLRNPVDMNRVKTTLSRVLHTIPWMVLATFVVLYSDWLFLADPDIIPNIPEPTVDLIDARGYLQHPFRTEGWFSPNTSDHQPGPIPYMAVIAAGWVLAAVTTLSPYTASLLVNQLLILGLAFASVILIRKAVGRDAGWVLGALIALSVTTLGGVPFSMGSLYGPAPVPWLALVVTAALVATVRKVPSAPGWAIFFAGLLAQSHFLAVPYAIVVATYSVWAAFVSRGHTHKWLLHVLLGVTGWIHLAVRYLAHPETILETFAGRNSDNASRSLEGHIDALAHQIPGLSNTVGLQLPVYVSAAIAAAMSIMALFVLYSSRRRLKGAAEVALVLGVAVSAGMTAAFSYESHHTFWLSGPIMVICALTLTKIRKGKPFFVIAALASMAVFPHASWAGPVGQPVLTPQILATLSAEPASITVLDQRMSLMAQSNGIIYSLLAAGADICINVEASPEVNYDIQGIVLSQFRCTENENSVRSSILIVPDVDESAPLELRGHTLIGRSTNLAREACVDTIERSGWQENNFCSGMLENPRFGTSSVYLKPAGERSVDTVRSLGDAVDLLVKRGVE